VYVLNSRNTESAGTKIHAHSDRECGVTAVTAKPGVATVDIELHEKVQPKMLHALYDSFDRHYCPIEWMGASARRLSLVVGSADALPQIAENLRAVASVTWVNHQALVSLVGDDLPDQAEVATRSLLALAGLDARVVSHSGREQSVSFLLSESDAQKAVQRLHKLFFSERKQPISVRANVASLCQAGGEWQ
jgi:aspartokinase